MWVDIASLKNLDKKNMIKEDLIQLRLIEDMYNALHQYRIMEQQ